MKVLSVFLVIVVLFSLVGCGDNFDAEAEKEALETAMDNWWDAFVKGDVAAKAELVNTSYTGYIGNRDGQGKVFWSDLVNLGLQDFQRTVHEGEWLIGPDLAVYKSYETWLYPDAPWESFITVVWAKNDGQWKIVHTHQSDLH